MRAFPRPEKGQGRVFGLQSSLRSGLIPPHPLTQHPANQLIFCKI